MRVLIDECLPKKLKREMLDHDVMTVQERGWSSKKNGELLQNMSLIKDSILMGSIMGTFVIESFGTERLFEITKYDIMNRFDRYKKMISI